MSDKLLRGHRGKSTRLKTAKGRKLSSTLWLERQLNDPYVALSKKDGYFSRAAYKLIEIDDKMHIFKKNDVVVDLGASPGSWSQVAVQKVLGKDLKGKGKVIAIDLQPMRPVPHVEFILGDFLEEGAAEQLIAGLGGKQINVVLSDMAAASSGQKEVDHIRIMHLCEVAKKFAAEHLAKGGHFVAKLLQGGGSHELVQELKREFDVVKHIKPSASRKDSSEMYIVAKGFKGRMSDERDA